MNRPIEILSTLLSDFEVNRWDKKPLFYNYQRLTSYVSAHLGIEYTALFAQPRPSQTKKGDTLVAWITPNLGDEPTKLSSLSGDEFEQYQSILKKQLSRIKALIKNIEKSEEEIRWAEILTLSIKFGGNDFVFTGNGKVVLAAWSMLPKTNSPYVSNSNEEPSTTEPSTTEPNTDYSLPNEPLPPDEQPVPVSQSDENQSLVSESSTQNTLLSDENPPRTREENSDGAIHEPPDNHQLENKNEPPINSNKKTFFVKHKWWWVALFILLIFLIAWKYFDLASLWTKSPLPEAPGQIVPIDPVNIGLDKDSLVTIVTDRLNIALRGENKDLKAFAKAFKKVYPDDAYAILYFDTLTNRIQVQLPKDEREAVKKALKNKLPEFKMLIWHESLFQRNSTPDPAFGDMKKKWHLDAIKAPAAWATSLGDEKIIIAVADNGFDLSHPELAAHIYKPYNVVNRTNNVFTNKNAKHGSHVAGLAVAVKGNGEGLCGVSPICSWMPIQVADQYGNITTTAVIDAVLYAVNNGADVINLSLGLKMSQSVTSFPRRVQQDMIENTFLEEEVFWDDIYQIAEESNTTLVLAAGNDNVLTGLDPMQRNALGIKVNAVDPNLNKASFSNYGAYSTLSAPGVKVFSSVPENNYEYLDGTSMASPIVAGGVALIKSMDKNITTRQIIDLLVDTGKPIHSATGIVGNLIQLDKALAALSNHSDIPIAAPEDICPDVRYTIDSLRRELERLEALCPDANAGGDTLKIPNNMNGLGFLTGRWKSTTQINNDKGGKVNIYFDFRSDGTGTMTLIEPNSTQCSASIVLQVGTDAFDMDQPNEARCNDSGNSAYSAYTFTCSRNQNGYAECTAQNKTIPANKVTFNLIKI